MCDVLDYDGLLREALSAWEAYLYTLILVMLDMN